MKAVYKETIVRWMYFDINADVLEHEELEDIGNSYVLERVQRNDWDGEELLESTFEVIDDQ